MCYTGHKMGHYVNKCPETKANDTNRPLKVRKMEEGNIKEDPEKKSIHQFRVRFSDLEKDTKDPIMRYWIILSGKIRIGPDNEGHLPKVFVDTGANLYRQTATRSQENFMKS